jgi:putative aminopeptidase FrvX
MKHMHADGIARRSIVLAFTLALAANGEAEAQAPTLRAVLPGWVGLIAAPGRERAATDAIMKASPGWTRGTLGTLVRRTGSGSPRRVIACALDRPAYSVSEITADGYLRVHDAEPSRAHPLWDQFHEGQRVLVQTSRGTVPGVFAVRSTHLWRRRPALQDVTTADGLWLDIGVRSAAEARALGVGLLDAVVRELPAWTYGADADAWIAGPGAVARTDCAVVAALAGSAPAHGENVYVIATQTSFGAAGITSALARLGAFDELAFLSGSLPIDSAAVKDYGGAPIWRGTMPTSATKLHTVALRARFLGTLLESVRSSDADALLASAAMLMDVPLEAVRPVTLPAPSSAPATTDRHDALSETANLLARFSDTYAVSGHEAPMREAILRELPAWARTRTTVDSAGNLILALGPERDTSVVMAHVDEIGFEVTRIAHDGTVSLATRGGFFGSLWEGQPALLHTASPTAARANGACGAASDGPIRGLFVPRDSATRKQPGPLTAWFGLDSAALAAKGVKAGTSVTAYKCAARLASQRFTARSIDDRAGVTALVLAVRRLQPSTLRHKVIFVWSVREEIGLNGAIASGAEFGRSVNRVYAIDTFVSSDSPLESTRFAHTPIGAGTVLRALDNSSVTDPAETARILALGRAHHIALQVGTTNGGNDGSELTRYGAMDIPIGWPSRYSHSPVELLDLRDVRGLADLVYAIATTH